MINELKLACKRRPTIRTHEWIQRAMKTRMHNLQKYTSQKQTLKQPNKSRHTHEMILLRKRFTAIVTNKRPFARVKLGMGYEMSLQRKRPTTLRTYKRTLSAVYLQRRVKIGKIENGRTFCLTICTIDVNLVLKYVDS